MPLVKARATLHFTPFSFDRDQSSQAPVVMMILRSMLSYINLGRDAPQLVAGGGVEHRQVLRGHVREPLKMQCIVAVYHLLLVTDHLQIDVGVSAVPVHAGHHDVALEIPAHRHQHCVIVAVSCSSI